MKINVWQLGFQIAAEISAVQALKPGDTTELPTIHVKSGTTTVEVAITVSEDAPKK